MHTSSYLYDLPSFVGQPKTIPIRVKTPINFPIDVYYLMDLSDTMSDDLKQVREFGPKLGTYIFLFSYNAAKHV